MIDYGTMTEEERRSLLRELSKPFKPESIKQKPGGGGKTFDYVDGATVVRRLNEATAGRWSAELLSREVREDGKVPVEVAHVRLHVYGLGFRDGIGIQELQPGGGADMRKGSLTDGIKNAAWKFGVAIELYGEDLEASSRDASEEVVAKKFEVEALTALIKREFALNGRRAAFEGFMTQKFGGRRVQDVVRERDSGGVLGLRTALELFARTLDRREGAGVPTAAQAKPENPFPDPEREKQPEREKRPDPVEEDPFA